MKRGWFSKFGLIIMAGLLSWSFFGCGGTKELAENEKPAATIKSQKPMFYLQRHLLYNTFAGKLSFKLVTPDKKQSARAVLNLHKGLDVLASIRALGTIEVGKAYATKDSLFGINRLDKSAYALSYQDGLQLLSLDLPFSSLQNLITGTILLPETTPVTSAEEKNGFFVITQRNHQFNQVTQYDLQTSALKKLILTALDGSFDCTIDYDDYRKIGIGQSFAYSRNIIIHNHGKEISLAIDFIQAEIDRPVNTGFSIPASYNLRNRP